MIDDRRRCAECDGYFDFARDQTWDLAPVCEWCAILLKRARAPKDAPPSDPGSEPDWAETVTCAECGDVFDRVEGEDEPTLCTACYLALALTVHDDATETRGQRGATNAVTEESEAGS